MTYLMMLFLIGAVAAAPCEDVVPLLCASFTSTLNDLNAIERPNVAAELCSPDHKKKYHFYCAKTCSVNAPSLTPESCGGTPSSNDHPVHHGFEETEKAFLTGPEKTSVPGDNSNYSFAFLHRGFDGGVTQFSYDGEIHPHILIPHHYAGADVTVHMCTDDSSVTLSVSSRAALDEWVRWIAHDEGMKFHVLSSDNCAGDNSVYRNVTAITEVDKTGNPLTSAKQGSAADPLYVRLQTTAVPMAALIKDMTIDVFSSNTNAGTVDPERRRQLREMEAEHRSVVADRNGRKLLESRRQLSKCNLYDEKKCTKTWSYDKEKTVGSGKGVKLKARVKTSVGFSAQVKWSWGGLKKYTKISIFGDAHAYLTAKSEKGKKLYDYDNGKTLFDTKLASLPISLGPLGGATIDIHLKGEVHLKMSVKTRGSKNSKPHFNAHVKGSFTIGKKYNGDQWKSISKRKFEHEMKHYDDMKEGLKIDVTPSITFTPRMKLNHFFKIELSAPITASVKVTLQKKGSCKLHMGWKPKLKIDIKMKCKVAAKKWGMGVDIYEMSPVSRTVYEKKWKSGGVCAFGGRRRLDDGITAEESTTITTKLLPAGRNLEEEELLDDSSIVAPVMASACPNDCSGNGACIHDDNTCECGEGWTGIQCSEEVIRFIPETGKSQPGDVVVPGKCIFKPSNVDALGLSVCAGKTSASVCVDPSLANTLDADAGLYVKKVTALGRSCTHALSNHYCRNVFPAADPTSWALMPVTHAHCVTELTECLSADEAETKCTDVGPSRLGPFASVASPYSVGPTAPDHKADLDDHSHNAHCIANTTILTGCPHRIGYKSFLDTHAFASVAEADTWVGDIVSQLSKNTVMFAGLTADQIEQCVGVRRDQLCSVHLPVCQESGKAPQRIRFAECQAMWKMCPSVMRNEWELKDATDCGNNDLFFVRNYVGQDEHTCGYNSTEAMLGAIMGRNVPELSNNSSAGDDASVFDSLSPFHVLAIGIGAGCALCGLIAVAVVGIVKVRRGGSTTTPASVNVINPIAEAKTKDIEGAPVCRRERLASINAKRSGSMMSVEKAAEF